MPRTPPRGYDPHNHSGSGYNIPINNCPAVTNTVPCVVCETPVGDTDRSRTYGERPHTVCEDCFQRYFQHCSHCGDNVRISSEGHYYMSGDDMWFYCQRCADRHLYRCDRCRFRCPRDRMHGTPYDGTFCPECYEATSSACTACDERVHNNYVRWNGDSPYCDSCASSRDEWDQQEFVCENPTFETIKTRRKFGVELETSRCEGHWELAGCTIWGCTFDCSIGGKEFISPPLIGDEGLAELQSFCDEMQNRDWAVDQRCGLHIHFDMAEMTDEQLFSVAYAYRLTWNMWKRFVSRDRGRNDMCGSPRYTTAEIRAANDWEYFVGARDRFEYVNWRAFFKHGTFEVRIGEATLSGGDIEKWLNVHAMFIEATKDMSYNELDLAFGDGESHTRAFSFCALHVWKDNAITRHLRGLCGRFHGHSLQVRTTYADHAYFTLGGIADAG